MISGSVRVRFYPICMCISANLPNRVRQELRSQDPGSVRIFHVHGFFSIQLLPIFSARPVPFFFKNMVFISVRSIRVRFYPICNFEGDRSTTPPNLRGRGSVPQFLGPFYVRPFCRRNALVDVHFNAIARLFVTVFESKEAENVLL